MSRSISIQIQTYFHAVVHPYDHPESNDVIAVAQPEPVIHKPFAEKFQNFQGIDIIRKTHQHVSR